MCARTRDDGMAFFAVSAGERTVPGVWHENYWLRRHEVVYEQVARLVRRGTIVLDAGCGEGYGAAALAQREARVLALDYDAATARHLALSYPEIASVRGNLVALPLHDDSVDLLVSLQTIEHLWSQDTFVAECARVLRPGATIVISTPNRHTFPPGNVFHHRELDAGELAALMQPCFDDVVVRGVFHCDWLERWEERHGSVVDGQLAAPPEEWSPDLADAVRSVRTRDFAVEPRTDDCLDLVAIGRAR